MKNPRRAYDKDGNEFVPLNLAVTREHGCQTVMVERRRYGHNAIVNEDTLDGSVPVPDVAIVWPKLVCSQCGSRGEALNVRPDWLTRTAARTCMGATQVDDLLFEGLVIVCAGAVPVALVFWLIVVEWRGRERDREP